MFDKLKRPLAWLALLSALLPSAAGAQQVHLACVLPSADPKTPELHFAFTLDEIAGTVSYYWNNRSEFRRPVFTADTVTWDQPFYLGTIIRRSINRTTLEYADETIDGRKVTTSKGTCKVVTPSPDRRF